MADIIIRGMEMPKTEGQIYHVRICPDGKVLGYYGQVIGQAIELPEHGRLIDADALEYWKDDSGLTAFDYVTRSQINDAPTIIPASGGDENGS